MTRALLLALAWAGPVASQTTPAPAPRIPIVVYQFTSDAGHQELAANFGRMLVRALRSQPTFEVMSRPRAEGGRQARYAVVGQVAARGPATQVTVQLLEIDRVAIVARDTVVMVDPGAAAAYLARRFQAHLVPTASAGGGNGVRP
jgi:hypothetical protein